MDDKTKPPQPTSAELEDFLMRAARRERALHPNLDGEDLLARQIYLTMNSLAVLCVLADFPPEEMVSAMRQLIKGETAKRKIADENAKRNRGGANAPAK